MATEARVTVIGLGRVGASLGLALQKVKTNFQIVGHDKDPQRANRAQKLGAVDRTHWNLPNAVEGAGLVFLAIPALEVKATLEAILPDLASGAIVTDTASTKARIMDWAAEILPPGINFVGGHPVLSGDGEPSADLLVGAHYVLIPGSKSDPEALHFMTDLVSAFGASPFFLDAQEHDGLMAPVAHLPAALSVLLMRALAASGSWEDFRRLAGARDFLERLAPGSQAEQRGAVLTNRAGLLAWIDRLETEIGRFKEALRDEDEEALGRLFEEAFEARARWESGASRPAEAAAGELGWSRWLGLGARRRPPR